MINRVECSRAKEKRRKADLGGNGFGKRILPAGQEMLDAAQLIERGRPRKQGREIVIDPTQRRRRPFMERVDDNGTHPSKSCRARLGLPDQIPEHYAFRKIPGHKVLLWDSSNGHPDRNLRSVQNVMSYSRICLLGKLSEAFAVKVM